MNIIENKINKTQYNIASIAINIELGRAPDIDRCCLVKRVIRIADQIFSSLSQSYRECRKQLEEADAVTLDLSLENHKLSLEGDEDFLEAIHPDIFMDEPMTEKKEGVADNDNLQKGEVMDSSKLSIIELPDDEEESSEVSSSSDEADPIFDKEEKVIESKRSEGSHQWRWVAAGVASVGIVVLLSTTIWPYVVAYQTSNASGIDCQNVLLNGGTAEELAKCLPLIEKYFNLTCTN